MRLFTPTELRIIAIAVGVATAVAIVITVAASMPGSRRDQDSPELPTGQGPRVDVRVSDLIIPEEFLESDEPDWFYYRERQTRWTDEQVSRYWVDPRIIGLEVLERRNDEIIEEMFEHVP